MTLGKHELRQLDLLAELASYGLNQSRDDENETYRSGGIETVGHMLACAICQWITTDSVPTSDVIESLSLDEYPPYMVLKTTLQLYVERLKQ